MGIVTIGGLPTIPPPPPIGGAPPVGPPVIPTPPPVGPPVVGIPVDTPLLSQIRRFLPNIGTINTSSMLRNAGIGAIYGGFMSLISNSLAVEQGTRSKAQAVGNVVGTTLSSALSGISFGIVGNLVIRGANQVFGLAGLPLAIMALTAGTVAAAVTHKVLEPVRGKIESSIASALGHRDKVISPWLYITPE